MFRDGYRFLAAVTFLVIDDKPPLARSVGNEAEAALAVCPPCLKGIRGAGTVDGDGGERDRVRTGIGGADNHCWGGELDGRLNIVRPKREQDEESQGDKRTHTPRSTIIRNVRN